MPTLRFTSSRRPVLVATLGVAVLATAMAVAAAGPVQAGPDRESMATPEPERQLEQVPEPGVRAGQTTVSGASTGTVCRRGAQWLRLRFTELSLRGNDSVTLSGNRGGTFTLTARHWPGKAFHTRAFRGDCVRVTPQLADPDSSYRVDAYQYASAESAVTVAAVGDVCGSSCDQTAAVVKAINPAALLLAGDNAYDSGTLSEYRNKYDPQYGQFRSIVRPTPGNHEYRTSGASGYFDYFGASAGTRGKGYYSFDVGDWHFVAMNSEISRGVGSEQEQWLRRDLAANTKPCTAAYWHTPRFSRGDHGDNTGVRPLYQALYDYGADLLVTGHDHNYQRFAPSRPDGTKDTVRGLRQFVIGTGGRGFYGFGNSSVAVTEASNANTFGVGKLTLSATGYRVDFVPVAGRTYTDTVSGQCHNASTSPDFAVTPSPAAVSVQPGGTVTTNVTVAGSNGFSAATTLSVSGLPAGVTATFAPNPVTPPANGTATSTLTVTASSSAAAGTAEVTITGTASGLSRTAKVQLSVTTGDTAFTDDFEADRGWTANPSGTDTATTGRWERGDPEETFSSYSNQVKQLGTTTSGAACLVTGRLAGASDGANDVDGGRTSIRSPQLALPSGSAHLTFRFTVAHGDNSGPDDYLRVKVVDGASTTTVFEVLGAASERPGEWRAQTVDLSQFAGRTVHLLVEAADVGTASLWESAIDDLDVSS